MRYKNREEPMEAKNMAKLVKPKVWQASRGASEQQSLK